MQGVHFTACPFRQRKHSHLVTMDARGRDTHPRRDDRDEERTFLSADVPPPGRTRAGVEVFGGNLCGVDREGGREGSGECVRVGERALARNKELFHLRSKNKRTVSTTHHPDMIKKGTQPLHQTKPRWPKWKILAKFLPAFQPEVYTDRQFKCSSRLASINCHARAQHIPLKAEGLLKDPSRTRAAQKQNKKEHS